MKALVRIGIAVIVLSSAAGACLATYLIGYREGLKINATQVETPPPSVGQRLPAGGLGQVTKRTLPFDQRVRTAR